MGESRQELLAWLNNLLQLNFTKVEQCGTGAAYCQIFDSIFMDVPMTKVKFNVNSEYMYIQNFKVLQNTFARHHIDKTVSIESLVKCKMQDNLEFLQYTKRYWDQFYPGGEYDAVARRKGTGAGAPAALQQENVALRETIAGLQRETDFYFRKLRDIELLIQQAIEADPELDKEDDGLLKQIQAILYSTEEGFEIPTEGEAEPAAPEEETF